MEKVRVEGFWAGVIEVELVTWTVEMLRAEVANRSGSAPQSLSLVSSGGILLDGYSLRQLGIRNNARILSNRIIFEPNGEQHVFFEKMWRKFAKISEVLERAEQESDGQPGNDDVNDEQEDQSERKFDLGSRADQKAALLGLTIHWEAKLLLNWGKYNGALELLDIAERTFLLCNQKNLEMLDNVVLLNIDTVWCHFMLQDIPAITAAGNRLKKARDGLKVALERDFSRITRFLRGVPLPETALGMKLELLEGVVAYHNQRLEDARELLESAKEKHLQLDVPEDSLSFIMSMGYEERDANTAIRVNDNKVFKALEFLETKKSEPKRERDCSPSAVKKMKSLKVGKLKDLVSVGFDMFLVVEALRKNNNDKVKAFIDLINSHTNTLLEGQRRGSKRQRTLAVAPVREPNATSFEVKWPFDASDSSSESSDDDTDDEEERVDLVHDLATVTAPPDYDIEYYCVGDGIDEYLDLVPKRVSKLESGITEDANKLDD